MARRSVVEVQCSRCERKEMQELDEGMLPATAGDPAPVQFSAALRLTGEDTTLTVTFEDLCTPCQRSVRALLEQAGKKIEGVSPDRMAKPKATKKGAAEGQTHNGSTPHAQPHAPADSKKPAPARSV